MYKNRGKGKIAEDKFNDLMGADAVQLEVQVGHSKRYVDNVLNGTAREIKSGKVVEWHCFDEVDDSFITNVKTELQKAGLKESDFKIIKY